MSTTRSPAGHPIVMIVDDDRTMVTLLTTLLELDGFRVVQAGDAGSILQRIEAEHPDLVLMDVFLKNQDGVELVRAMRKQPTLALLPVVMTSGMDVSEKCMAAGANSFVLKPYDPEVLLQTIRDQLAQAGGAEKAT